MMFRSRLVFILAFFFITGNGALVFAALSLSQAEIGSNQEASALNSVFHDGSSPGPMLSLEAVQPDGSEFITSEPAGGQGVVVLPKKSSEIRIAQKSKSISAVEVGFVSGALALPAGALIALGLIFGFTVWVIIGWISLLPLTVAVGMMTGAWAGHAAETAFGWASDIFPKK